MRSLLDNMHMGVWPKCDEEGTTNTLRRFVLRSVSEITIQHITHHQSNNSFHSPNPNSHSFFVSTCNQLTCDITKLPILQQRGHIQSYHFTQTYLPKLQSPQEMTFPNLSAIITKDAYKVTSLIIIDVYSPVNWNSY